MRTILILLSVLTLSCTSLQAQRRTAPAANKQRDVLFDFRLDRPTVPLKLSAATQRSVLSKIFRKYLTDESKCKRDFDTSSDDFLLAARNAGQMVPSIVDMATGSFTEAGQTQTAYVISVSECNASHAENFGSKRIAIFAGQQLVANVDSDYKVSIVRTTDLNGDGVNELLMTSGDMNQGIAVEMGALLDFQHGRLRVIEDLGTVVEDSCASEMPGSSSKAAVVSLMSAPPGKMPKLHIDNYEAKCSKNRRWRFISSGKME